MTVKTLEENVESYRLLFERNPSPMWVYDRETLAFLAVNEAAIRHYGYSQEEFLQMTLLEIHPPPLQPLVHQIAHTLPGSFRRPGTFTHRKKDGSTLEAEITTTDILFNNRPARLVLAQDVSERVQLEKQLLQSQKMEGIGRLAGGIAHDFNNLLTAILGYVELAEMKLQSGQSVQEELGQIRLAGERAATLTRQLLAFARQQILSPKVLNLNDLILSTDRLLRRIIGEDIELVITPQDNLWPVRVDPSQFEQVLINLAVNARDAMPKGGKLTLETANVTLDEEYTRCHMEVAPGDYVMIAISDTGIGMDETVQAHMFEPFFTTKENGTGLGLATCYGIVKQGNGHIWVYSEPGNGTTIKIYLPRIQDAVDTTALSSAVASPGGHETILLVEDEPVVCQFAVQALRAQGYQVLEASNGEEALQIAQEYEGEIHLLLTDVVMPKMSGKVLATHLQTLRPNTKVLYVSGYTDNTIVHHGVLEERVAFLQKPYTLSALAQKVREVLDANS